MIVGAVVVFIVATAGMASTTYVQFLKGSLLLFFSGLFVSVYDKDLFFDDRLGQSETDANGNYSLTYRTEDFRDLIERKPDLYLKVIDKKGKTLYTTKGQVWYEAGRIETIDVKIDR